MKIDNTGSYIGNCIFCGSVQLREVLRLSDSPLCDNYLIDRSSESIYFPLALNLCAVCSNVQLNYLLNPSQIYEKYIYETACSPGLRAHFKTYASDVIRVVGEASQRVVESVLDIGSNDGTLLAEFKNLGVKEVFGVEASREIADLATRSGVPTLNGYFNSDWFRSSALSEVKFDLITVNNLFANIPNVHCFMDGVSEALSHRGVFVIESSYVISMVESGNFDFIYHEHLTYLSLKSVSHLMSMHNFEVFDVERVGTKGGSLRYYIGRNGLFEKTARLMELSRREVHSLRIFDDLFLNLQDHINRLREAVIDLMSGPLANDRLIWSYGASATTTTQITTLGYDGYLSYLVDDNVNKQGRFSPVAQRLPVISLEQVSSVEGYRDSLCVINAWRFLDSIVHNLKATGLRGKAYVFLPDFRIISL